MNFLYMKKYILISNYIEKVLKKEKQRFKVLEWVFVPCFDYPLIARVVLNEKGDVDQIETECHKYLNNGIMVIIRPDVVLSQKELDKVFNEPQKPMELPRYKIPASIKNILEEIKSEAVSWLIKNKVNYLCLYEIMYEKNIRPAYCIVTPNCDIDKNLKWKEKYLLKSSPLEYLIGNREIILASESNMNHFLNLIYLTESARKKNKSVISYLKIRTKHKQ